MKKVIRGAFLAFLFAVMAVPISAGPAFAANNPPQIVGIAPSSGVSPAGQTVYFTAVYSDPNGWQDLRAAYLLVNANISSSQCLYAYYNRTVNALYLGNDAGTICVGGYAPGYPRVIENSCAKLDCSKTVVSGSGKNLTIKWAVTFKSPFTGTKNAYLYVIDNLFAAAGWTKCGAWTVTPSDTTPPTGSVLINKGAPYTKTASVTLNLSAQDNSGGSGVCQMKFSNDNVGWSAPETYAASKTWTLPSGDGKKTVYVKFSDNALNWSAAYSGGITLAAAPPVADFTASPLIGEVPLTAQFTDRSTGGVTGWSWNFGDGAASAQQNPAHTYSGRNSWEVEYAANELPDNSFPAWTRYCDADPAVEAIEESALHIKRYFYLDGGCISYQRPATFKASTAYIVETRFRMGHSDVFLPGLAAIYVVDDKYAWRLDFSPYDITIQCGIDVKATYRMDTVSDYHTYRVRADNGIIEVFVDGVKRMKADMTYTSQYGPYTPSIAFGQLVRLRLDNYYNYDHEPYVETYWDYVRYHSAPTTMGYENYYKVSLTVSGPAGSNIKTKSDYIDALPPQPEIFTAGLPDGVIRKYYSEQLYADYAIQSFTWSVISGTLPPGLWLNNSWPATIGGWPTQAGTYGFTLGLTDYKGRTDTKYIEMKIEPYPPRTDYELLIDTMAGAAKYFYYEALTNGFVKDNNFSSGCSSVAATGFGLAAMCILDQFAFLPDNQYCSIPAAQIRARVNQILDNCIAYQGQQAQYGNNYGIGGFLYHLVNSDGTRYGSSEVSTIDMAVFMAGAVTAGEYFGGEIKDKAETIYNNLNWRLFLVPASKRFSHGWNPNYGYIGTTWDRPGDEALLVSIMALGKEPDARDFLETMYSWPRVQREYGGHKVYNSYFGSLFTYYLAHCFVDFEKLGCDNPAAAGFSNVTPINWWQNSVEGAYADRQFCIDNSAEYPNAYGPDSWGITPCYSPWNYAGYLGVLGAAPCESGGGMPMHSGVIATCGAISCLPLMRVSPDESPADNPAFRALKNYYVTYYGNGLWDNYGPKDSFGDDGQACPTYLGINLGPEALMIENYTTRLIWNSFMKNPRVSAALGRIFA